MEETTKILICLDTNVLENWHNENHMFLYNFSLARGFYKLKKFITDNELTNRIRLCIPEIALMEIKKHMQECYIQKSQSLKDVIDIHKMTFGDLLDISCEFRLPDIAAYSNWLDESIKLFFEEPHNYTSVLTCPKDEHTVCKIISKAINTEKPFVKSRSGQKDCTDAGLKDALIYETFVSNLDENTIGIFVSNDHDFSSLFHEKTNMLLCTDYDSVISCLKHLLNITDEQTIVARFENDEYLQRAVVAEAGLDSKARVSFDDLIACSAIHNVEGNEPTAYNIKVRMYVGMEKYVFDIEYEPNANELLRASIITQEEDINA